MYSCTRLECRTVLTLFIVIGMLATSVDLYYGSGLILYAISWSFVYLGMVGHALIDDIEMKEPSIVLY